MTISLKANAAGTQGEILLNGTPVQTFNQNTLQVSGQVLVAGAQSNEYHSLTRKDYVDTKIAKTGDTMTGQLNGITPVAEANLTRKDYVDSATSGAAFSAARLSQLNLTSGVATAIPDMSAEFNVGNAFSGQRFQPTKPGIYQVNGGVRVNGTTLSAVSLSINKSNASLYEIVTFSANATGINGGSGGVSIYLNGATDWVELSITAVGTSPFVVSAQFSACFLQPA